VGRLRDDGITNKFLKTLQKELQPNTSVLVLFARSDAERRKQIAIRLAKFDPKILESDLSADLEREILSEMQDAQKSAAAGAAGN